MAAVRVFLGSCVTCKVFLVSFSEGKLALCWLSFGSRVAFDMTEFPAFALSAFIYCWRPGLTCLERSDSVYISFDNLRSLSGDGWSSLMNFLLRLI